MLAMDHAEAPLLASLPLPQGASVVVAGAYKGDTVAFLRKHYPDVTVSAYEPQQWALDQIPYDPLVVKMPYALAPFNGTLVLHSFGTDAASLCVATEETSNTQQRENVPCIDAAVVLATFRDRPMSLLLLNVEGYEYTLLPYLLDNGIVPVRLMVQFHHYKTHEVAAFVGLQDRLRTMYVQEREVGKGWWYYA